MSVRPWFKCKIVKNPTKKFWSSVFQIQLFQKWLLEILSAVLNECKLFFKKRQKPINHSFPSVSLWWRLLSFFPPHKHKIIFHRTQQLYKLDLNFYCLRDRCLMVETIEFKLTSAWMYIFLVYSVDPEPIHLQVFFPSLMSLPK